MEVDYVATLTHLVFQLITNFVFVKYKTVVLVVFAAMKVLHLNQFANIHVYKT
jgi:hypothetical protein